jgi:hypothetical protein
MIRWSGKQTPENYCKRRSFANISTALCAKGQRNNFIGNILLPRKGQRAPKSGSLNYATGPLWGLSQGMI